MDSSFRWNDDVDVVRSDGSVIFANQLGFEQAFGFEQCEQFANGIFDGQFVGTKGQFGIGGCFVWVIDTGEAFDFASACFFVQAFGVALFSFVQWAVNKDFEEGDVGFFVELADGIALGSVGADEAGDGEDT